MGMHAQSNCMASRFKAALSCNMRVQTELKYVTGFLQGSMAKRSRELLKQNRNQFKSVTGLFKYHCYLTEYLQIETKEQSHLCMAHEQK
jgi:hypothetical protein